MKRHTSGFRGRIAAGAAVTAALLVPLAVFGGPALARSAASADEYGGAQYQYKVTICHMTGSKKHPAHTISVAASAVPAHLRHGDHLGPCLANEPGRKKHNNGQGHAPAPATTVTAPTTAPTHGHGNDNGDNGNHGNGNNGSNGKGHGK